MKLIIGRCILNDSPILVSFEQAQLYLSYYMRALTALDECYHSCPIIISYILDR